mmetsp:Transcript_64413/g.114560  ORF Transcript_64413/g.114560 Transcript_64413/m.114560 type:complete len:128 (+) Transcript_64413:73-456(+)
MAMSKQTPQRSIPAKMVVLAGAVAVASTTKPAFAAARGELARSDRASVTAHQPSPVRGTSSELNFFPMLAASTASLLAVRRVTQRTRTISKASLSESAISDMGYVKTKCLHPDRPMMFACNDCPRRS